MKKWYLNSIKKEVSRVEGTIRIMILDHIIDQIERRQKKYLKVFIIVQFLIIVFPDKIFYQLQIILFSIYTILIAIEYFKSYIVTKYRNEYFNELCPQKK